MQSPPGRLSLIAAQYSVFLEQLVLPNVNGLIFSILAQDMFPRMAAVIVGRWDVATIVLNFFVSQLGLLNV